MDDALHKTLRSLQVVRDEKEPLTMVEWTGCVALFSLCFWEIIRAMRTWLSQHGEKVGEEMPVEMVIQAAGKAGLITDEPSWLKAAQVKDPAYFPYTKSKAMQVIQDTKGIYLPMFEIFVAEFDQRLAEETNDE